MEENIINLFSNLLGILKFENISLFTYKPKNDKSNTPAVLLNILASPSETHSHNKEGLNGVGAFTVNG